MAARQIYDPEGFRNIETDGRITGYQFRFKAQYYRGITLSIIRDIQINIDGESAKKEDIRFTVNGETFTMEEMRTVIDSDYRWEFGEFAGQNRHMITLNRCRIGLPDSWLPIVTFRRNG